MLITRSITSRLLLCGLLLAFFCASGLAREKEQRKTQSFAKTTATQSTRTINNIGNWTYWLLWDGQGGSDPLTGSFGGLYPRGSVSTIFADGLVWGGIVADPTNPGFDVRVGGSTFISGVNPGYISASGSRVDASSDPRIRIYRIRSDWRTLGPSQVLRDAAELNGITPAQVSTAQIQAVLDQYEADWNEWPVDLGAPYVDVDGDGAYNPEIDKAGLADADQVTWMVANDLEASTVNDLYGAPPLGVEYRITTWSYNQPAARLGQIIFKKFELVNRSNLPIDSMYVGMWSDPDLGSSGDDVVGVDSLLSLGYVYNGGPNDGQYATLGLPPAAAGYDFFQGPLVAGKAGQDLNKNGIDDAVDTGIFNLERTGPGFINLPVTSFAFFAAGDAVISDPPLGEYDGTRGWYNLLRGFIPTFDIENPTPFTHRDGPFNGRVTKFPLNGDPVAGTGDIDANGNNLPPADRRMSLNSGPFVLQPGETQEIVVALLGALGDGYLSSVSELKETDRVAQSLFDNLFGTVPKPPVDPVANVVELEKKIILDWGSDLANIAAVEADNAATGYRFEGYNVYQLPNGNAALEEGMRIATFDKANGITTIFGKKLIEETGRVEVVAVQQGSDNGIKRFFEIDHNYLTGDELFTGNAYYFAVTAYNYNDFSSVTPLIEDSTLESGGIVLEVIPQPDKPGFRGSEAGSEIPVVTDLSNSDGQVSVQVVNPLVLTGDDYEVYFTADEDTNSATFGEVLWNLRNVSQGNEVMLQKQVQANSLAERNDQPVVEGVQVKVAGPPPGVNSGGQGVGWDIPSGTRRFTFAGGADGFGFEGFNGAIGWDSPYHFFGSGPHVVAATDLYPVLLVLAQVSTDGTYDVNDPNVSYGYRYGRGFTAPPALPEFAPFIVNTASTGGYSYQDFTRSVPLAAYDVSDPDNPRRLAVGHLENNQPGGLVDGKWWPGDFNVHDNTAGAGPREWLFIYNADYSETANPDFEQDVLVNPVPVMYFLTVARRGDVPFSPGGTGEDEFLIINNKPNSVADIFQFGTNAPTYSDEVARRDADNIKAFPVPYYAFNQAEPNRFTRFITFNHLPQRAVIRIFNLAGLQVRKLEKDSDSQYLQWDIKNESNLPVASGIYFAHVDLPDLDKQKVVKLFIIQGEEILQFF